MMVVTSSVGELFTPSGTDEDADEGTEGTGAEGMARIFHEPGGHMQAQLQLSAAAGAATYSLFAGWAGTATAEEYDDDDDGDGLVW